MAGLRVETAGLVRLAERDLAALWQLVRDGAPAPEVLNDILPALVTDYGEMGSAVAADWYDGVRESMEARGAFRAIPLEASDRQVSGLIGRSLLTATDDEALEALIHGGVQRRIADHMRLTVANSSVFDPAAQGWMRVGRGSCDWCRQYLDGEVHMTEGYDFDAHDNCNCSVEPQFLTPGMLAGPMDEWPAQHEADRPFEAPKWEHEWTRANPLGPYDGLDDLSPEDYALNGMKYKARHALETRGGHTVLIDLDLTDVELQDLLDEVGTVLRVSQADLGGRPITFHFPRPGEDYYFINNPGAGAYVMKGSRTVVMKPSVTTAKAEAFSEHVMQHLVDVGAGWTPRHQLLAHEVGHIVDGQNFHSYVLDVAQASRRVPGDRVGARFVDETLKFFESLPTKSLSNYAHTNPSEAYAEAYVRWQLGGPGDPVADAFAERFGWVRWS